LTPDGSDATLCRVLALTLAALLAASSFFPQPPALDLARWQGKVVLVDFWASWCGPCRESFPWMARMQQQYGPRGLVVVTVDLDEDADAASRFLAAQPGAAAFTHVQDPEGRLAETFGLSVMPSSLLFDRQGRPVHRHEGFRPEDEAAYERRIVDLLESRGPEQALAIAPVAAVGLGVRPWERGLLADPAMQLLANPLEAEVDDHIYFSKEASSGGRGFGGGGCGCN
jgi:thiol-disulfide isomerase/thioredoxin